MSKIQIYIFIGLKKCSTCKIEKEICEFHKWKFGVDGYRRVCKECRKNETKKYYEKNSEKIKIKSSKKLFPICQIFYQIS